MYRFADRHTPIDTASKFPIGTKEKRRRETAFTVDLGLSDLLAFLEAEPAVTSYELVGGGIVDVAYWAGRVLVGALPASGPERLRVEELKRDHQRSGRRVVLVPEERLARRPFRDNRRIVASAAGSVLPVDQRLSVLEAIDETGSATLGDLARMIGTAEAASGILALVCDGTLRIDLSGPIGPASVLQRYEPLG